MYYLSCSRLLWFVNWSPSQVVLPFPWKGFLGPLSLFDQDDGLWSHLKLSSEIKSQMRWKSKDATFLPFDRDRSRHSHFIMKPADNGEDDKYFSIWSKRGLCWIKTGVFWHVVRRPPPPCSQLFSTHCWHWVNDHILRGNYLVVSSRHIFLSFSP